MIGLTRIRQGHFLIMRLTMFLVRCVDANAIPVTALKPVLQEWRKPSHAEFEPRNAWSLVNAVTEAAYKGRNPATNINRGQALHGIFDSLVLAG